MSNNESPRTPWWKTGLAIALASAIIPTATFIQGSLQSQKELHLQQEQQKQQLRLAYANLMVEGGVERVALLADFLAETEDEPKMKEWARKQQLVAQKQKAAAEAASEEAQRKAAAAEARRVEAEQRLAEANAEVERLKAQEAQRIKDEEAARLVASAAELQRLNALAEQERIKREEATRLAEKEAAALVVAENQAVFTKANSVKSLELLNGRPTTVRETFPREQMQMQMQQVRPGR